MSAELIKFTSTLLLCTKNNIVANQIERMIKLSVTEIDTKEIKKETY